MPKHCQRLQRCRHQLQRSKATERRCSAEDDMTPQLRARTPTELAPDLRALERRPARSG